MNKRSETSGPNLVWMLLALLAGIAYYFLQPANNYHLHPLADANEYEKIYLFFHDHQSSYFVRYGIHTRIVIPFLASLIKWLPMQQSFFLINLLFGIWAVYLLCRLMDYFRISQQKKIIALLFFILHWAGPFRANAISPVGVDMAVYCFEILFLLLFLEKKYIYLLLLTPLAVATKEVMLGMLLPLLLATLIHRYIYKNKSQSISWILGIFFLGIITKILLNYFFPSSSPGRNSALVMAFHFREALLHPDHFLRWLLALSAAFGGLLWLPLLKQRKFSLPTEKNITVYLSAVAWLAMSFLGGMDYTRLIFLGYPVLITTILLMDSTDRKLFLLAGVVSLTMTRFWNMLPDPSGDVKIWGPWMPEYAKQMHLISWILGTFLIVFLLVVARYFFRPDRSRLAE